MDIVSLYINYGLTYVTEGHKHSRPGWVNTACPFCTGNPGYHLGATLNGSHFYCWRCGWKPATLAISKLLDISYKSASLLVKEFGGVSEYIPKEVVKKEFNFPTNLQYLTAKHKKYLEDRNFDPQYITKNWNILSTSEISLLDGINYCYRILIPIYWDFQPVTFQCRDVTNKSPLKYMACPKQRELIEHKEILYGNPEKWKRTGICVEGVTDVWRFGVNSFATFGIEFTSKQIRLMAKRFNRIAVAYDFEPQAQKQADKLIDELRFRKVDAFKIPIENDPGSMNQEEANYLVKQIIKT